MTHSTWPIYNISQINPMQSNSLPPPYTELNPIISFKCLQKISHYHNFLKDVNVYFKPLIMHFYLLNKEGTALTIYPFKHLARFLQNLHITSNSLNGLSQHSDDILIDTTNKFEK